VAVHKYTGRKVDVIGYSMGCPISRKAILGGKCAESDENLGAPLTKLVDTFIGIGGTNYGAKLCSFSLFGDTCGMLICMVNF
jgi:triacylglycerol lipase